MPATPLRLVPALLGAFALSCTTARAAAPEPQAAPPGHASEAPGVPGVLDLDRVFELSRELRLDEDAFAGWLDGDTYLATEDDELLRVDVQGGESTPHFDLAAAQAAWEALPGVDSAFAEELATASRRALARGSKGSALMNLRGDLFYYRPAPGNGDGDGDEPALALRLTHDPAEEVGETLSPDGTMVAYISGWNLWVVPTAGGTPRALTDDGDENHLYGRLDWVYQEELYGRGDFQGYWWSPDSRRIAFLILDESEVPEYTIPDHRKNRPEVEVWRYPKAGDPNPKASLAVVDVAGGKHRMMDLSRYATQEFLIVRVGWRPHGDGVIAQVQDRVQTWLDVVAANPRTGETQVLFRDRTGVWVEPTDAPHWIRVRTTDEEGAEQLEPRMLWLSERDGWRHLYLYDEGELERQITSGEWEVDDFLGYDQETGWIYFSGDKADVKGQQLFRVNIDGTGLEQLTEEPGTHRVTLSPDFEHYVDSFSSHKVPPRLTLHTIDGALIRTLAEVDPQIAEEAGLITPELVQVKTRDGFTMEAKLVRPKDFDPSVRYPVLSQTYAGPHAQQVRDSYYSFNDLFHQMFASEGYLIWICDNRSASGKGLESVKPVYRNLGPLELRDLEDGIAWLVDQGLAEPSRVGLWGWSYGGFMTAYALTHSEVFSCGVIGAPVTDWRLYDTIYTERYMDTPQANPEGYDRTSVVKAAESLHGKALIIHGALDENVHMQNSLQLANALQDAGHLFELMLYPGNRHGVVQPKQRRHLYAMVADFFRRNL